MNFTMWFMLFFVVSNKPGCISEPMYIISEEKQQIMYKTTNEKDECFKLKSSSLTKTMDCHP